MPLPIRIIDHTVHAEDLHEITVQLMIPGHEPHIGIGQTRQEAYEEAMSNLNMTLHGQGKMPHA